MFGRDRTFFRLMAGAAIALRLGRSALLIPRLGRGADTSR